MFVNTERKDITDVLANSHCAILVERNYGGGVNSFVFPVSIPSSAFLAVYDDLIAIDNRSKWINGSDARGKSLLITQVCYNDGINIFINTDFPYSVNDFNLDNILRDIYEAKEKKDNIAMQCLPPDKIKEVIRIAYEESKMLPPYFPVTPYNTRFTPQAVARAQAHAVPTTFMIGPGNQNQENPGLEIERIYSQPVNNQEQQRPMNEFEASMRSLFPIYFK